MIQNLRIKNFVLIDDLDIDFHRGFNVLIGETGAGKSIIVNALTLLTGSRSQFDKLNDDTKKAVIEATFVLDEDFIGDHPFIAPYLEGNILVVSRALLPSKLTQIRLNGEVVTLNELKAVMADIVSITSQGEQSALMANSEQLKIVDRFLVEKEGNELLQDYRAAYAAYQIALKKRDEFTALSRANDLDVIQFKLEEIAKKNIREDEIETIRQILRNSEAILAVRDQCRDLNELYNSEDYENFAPRLSRALMRLTGVPGMEKAERALSLWNELSDNIFDLVAKSADSEIDEAQIERYNERLYELTPLMKKYGDQTAAILQAQRELENRLDEVANYENYLRDLEEEIVQKQVVAADIAARLTLERKKCAADIAKRVNGHLLSLGLSPEGFRIEFSPTALDEHGQDKVHFKVGLNRGHAYEDLAVAASGGEKSRLMLALIASLNFISRADTLVFDEVDTGVSGDVALIVGQKIREISGQSAVLAISHLPPVFAAAEHSYLVYKFERENRTVSTIRELNDEETVRELAKMIGGHANLDEALNLAQKMIAEQKN